MGPEVFLPHSLEPAILFYPVADGPVGSPSKVLKSIFILSNHLLLGFTKLFFLLTSSAQNHVCNLCVSHTYVMPSPLT